MALRISRALLAEIRDQALVDPDVEICGLLLGHGDTVMQIATAANVAPNPALFFELDPAVLISAHRSERSGGMRIMGHYHSHPGGLPEPSWRDAQCAMPDDRIWLIIAGQHMSAWRAVSDGSIHGRFNPEKLLLEPSTSTGGCIGV